MVWHLMGKEMEEGILRESISGGFHPALTAA
jgi:hypothetical protein